MTMRRILVPRHVDACQINAQNLNARALLARVKDPSTEWWALTDAAADSAVSANPLVHALQLWPWRFWTWRHWLLYLQPAAAVFYPGIEAVDASALRWSKRLYPQRPIIATLEGLAGDAEREHILTALAGHPVPCQYATHQQLHNIDTMLRLADHVIAISPFLAKMGEGLYGPKFSVLPLGIDTARFYPHAGCSEGRLRVVSAGTLTERKRPGLLLELATRCPDVDFVWYGTGPLLSSLRHDIAQRRLDNVSFAGAVNPDALAEAFRGASVFVLPSLSEGVPKVTQEAAACGLPVVLFGFFEAPSVVDEFNGFVVWDDTAFFDRTAQLLRDTALRKRMRDAALEMAAAWDWNSLAPQWESRILALVDQFGAGTGRPA